MSQHRHTALRRTALIALPLVGALVFAGCSGSGGDNAGGGSESGFSFALPVTNSQITNPIKALGEAYMKANPDVKITWNEIPNDSYGQTLNTQLNAGNASDVFQTAPGLGQAYSTITLAKAGVLAPLDQSAAASIPAGSEPQFQADGNTYGVALGLTFTGTVVNQTTVKAASATVPTDGKSLLATCADAEAQGKSVYALAGGAAPNTGLMAMVISATRVYAENPKWNQDRADGKVTFATSQGWKDTLQAVIDLKDAGCFQKGVEGGGFDAITNGITQGTSFAAFLPGNSIADLSQAAPNSDLTLNPFPPATGGKPFGLLGSNYALSLAEKSKDNKAAHAFLEWAASAPGQETYATEAKSFSLTSDLSGGQFSAIADIVSSGSFVPLPNSQWPNAAVYDALGTGVQGLLTGQKTPDAVLADMDAAWGN